MLLIQVSERSHAVADDNLFITSGWCRMIVTMKTPTTPTLLFALALLAASPWAAAQSIYKCTHAGQLEYTDHPCPEGTGEVIHQATDSEVIDQYLRLGQDAQARSYAESRHIEALYKQRVDAYQQAQDEKAQRDAQAAADAEQRDEQVQRQAAAANRGHLRAENEALREQNDVYRDELAQPASSPAPAYYGGGYAPPYRDPRHDHDHDHDHHPEPPPAKPVFHPCTQLAGGRVQC
jgi:hypothetical protein